MTPNPRLRFHLLSVGGALASFSSLYNTPVNVPELDNLIARAKAGDAWATERLMREHEPEVKKIASQFHVSGAERQDVIQEGRIGLWKAIRDFSPTGGMTFRNFANLCCRRHIITAMAAANRRKYEPLNNAASLDAPIEDDRGYDDLGLDDFLAADALPAVDQLIAREEADALLERLAPHLSSMEAVVFEEWLDGRGYEQVAEVSGTNLKQVDNTLVRVRAKAREIFGGEGREAFADGAVAPHCQPPPRTVHPPPSQCPRCKNRYGLEITTLERGSNWEASCFLCGHLWWTRRRIAPEIIRYWLAGEWQKKPE